MDLYPLIKPLLFRLDPEQAHTLAFGAMQLGGGALLGPLAPKPEVVNQAPIKIAGLSFRNPIGLAAGFDKNALCLPAWERLGFSHVEIGTVTPLPQPGNPTPRLFRLPADEALINRMGFNNDGAVAIARRLQARPSPNKLIVGGNIGKNKATEEIDAPKDYIACLEALHDVVDYFTINISSPNTQGLRNLQAREPLMHLLSAVQERNAGLPRSKPIFVKIAPDLDEAAMEAIVEVATYVRLAGIVATNTTLSRENLVTPGSQVEQMGAGGLSGGPLRERSLAFCTRLRAMMPPDLTLIACGGVMSGKDVAKRLEAGAALVQLYTGFVYRGPQLVEDALRAAAQQKSRPL